MKATLHFNLEEEGLEFERARRADEMAAVLSHLHQKFRSNDKHGTPLPTAEDWYSLMSEFQIRDLI